MTSDEEKQKYEGWDEFRENNLEIQMIECEMFITVLMSKTYVVCGFVH